MGQSGKDTPDRASRIQELPRGLRNGILVRQMSGSPFVTLSLETGQQLLHHYGEDNYIGRLQFISSGWIEVW